MTAKEDTQLANTNSSVTPRERRLLRLGTVGRRAMRLDLPDVRRPRRITPTGRARINPGSREPSPWRAGKCQPANVNYSELDNQKSDRNVIVSSFSAPTFMADYDKAVKFFHEMLLRFGFSLQRKMSRELLFIHQRDKPTKNSIIIGMDK